MDASPQIRFPSRSALVISRRRTAEMEPALDAIHQLFDPRQIRYVTDCPAVERLLDGGDWFPDLAVVCQHRPCEFSAGEVRRLLTLLPLARWVCACGAWCEADGRNPTPWPDSVRVRARAAAARIRWECRVLAGTAPALPLTASRDEVFAFDARPDDAPNHGVTCRVQIRTADRELRRVVGELLSDAGLVPPADTPAGPAIEAVVWDVDPLSPSHSAELRRFHAAHPEVAGLALATMAHPEDVAALEAAGCAAVIDKSQIVELLPPALWNVCR